mmetsp:Transcript_25391/g.52835  ORF Transcript_25391/g.52835 Transcript_25391/m.52835 type:complete len:201 (-) Transcript_25391:211-813(-)
MRRQPLRMAVDPRRHPPVPRVLLNLDDHQDDDVARWANGTVAAVGQGGSSPDQWQAAIEDTVPLHRDEHIDDVQLLDLPRGDSSQQGDSRDGDNQRAAEEGSIHDAVLMSHDHIDDEDAAHNNSTDNGLAKHGSCHAGHDDAGEVRPVVGMGLALFQPCPLPRLVRRMLQTSFRHRPPPILRRHFSPALLAIHGRSSYCC